MPPSPVPVLQHHCEGAKERHPDSGPRADATESLSALFEKKKYFYQALPTEGSSLSVPLPEGSEPEVSHCLTRWGLERESSRGRW
jgi:hypothetical protein